jgi:hypothetical protein
MRLASRLLVLAGAAGMALSALLPWVTIEGIGLDLGVIGARTSLGARTVTGTDTSIWPLIVVVAGVVAILGVLNVARKLLIGLGLLVVAAGAGLLYYVSNAVEIETSGHGAIARLIADALITSSTGPGTPLLLASGFVIVVGGLLAP